MEQYLKLLDFWNKTLKSDEVYKTNGKWIKDDNFNSTLKKYINENSKVLDFGCGSGWALIEASYTTAFKKGIGIDQSINGIECASKVTELSNIKNIEFIVGNQNCLKNYQNDLGLKKHQDYNGKQCPEWLLEGKYGMDWDWFKEKCME